MGHCTTAKMSCKVTVLVRQRQSLRVTAVGESNEHLAFGMTRTIALRQTPVLEELSRRNPGYILVRPGSKLPVEVHVPQEHAVPVEEVACPASCNRSHFRYQRRLEHHVAHVAGERFGIPRRE